MRTKDVELRQRVIDAYELLVNRDEKPTHKRIGEIVHGEEDLNAERKTQGLISRMKREGEWPFEESTAIIPAPTLKSMINNTDNNNRIGNNKINNNKISAYLRDNETEALVKVVRLLGSLKSDSMRKIIEVIKNGAYSFDEMVVLSEMSKIFDNLEEDARERLFDYIGSRFKI